jgi:hypothetical protein
MTKKHMHGDGPDPAEAWQALMTGSEPMMAAFGRVGETCAKACLEWQQEVARFIGARMKADADTQRSLAKCQTWADILKVQQEWSAAAAQAYADEATRLTEIAYRYTQVGLTPAVSGGRSPSKAES